MISVPWVTGDICLWHMKKRIIHHAATPYIISHGDISLIFNSGTSLLEKCRCYL